MKHSTLNDNGGGRAQVGYWFNETGALEQALTSGNQVYVAFDIYFPTDIILSGNYPWFSLGDFHVTDNNGNNRNHTYPGFFLSSTSRGGFPSMRIVTSFADEHVPDGVTSVVSSGQWHTMEWSWRWSAGFDVTIQVWIDGVLESTVNNARTVPNGQTNAELYMKAYGMFAGGTITPQPVIFYRKNVRVSTSPITH